MKYSHNAPPKAYPKKRRRGLQWIEVFSCHRDTVLDSKVKPLLLSEVKIYLWSCSWAVQPKSLLVHSTFYRGQLPKTWENTTPAIYKENLPLWNILLKLGLKNWSSALSETGPNLYGTTDEIINCLCAYSCLKLKLVIIVRAVTFV